MRYVFGDTCFLDVGRQMSRNPAGLDRPSQLLALLQVVGYLRVPPGLMALVVCCGLDPLAKRCDQWELR